MYMLSQRCSLSMVHRICEYVPGGVRLGGLDMSKILCMPSYLKSRGVKKYPIPFMVQIELAYISIKSEVVHPNIDSRELGTQFLLGIEHPDSTSMVTAFRDSAATAPGNCLSSQLRDVTDNGRNRDLETPVLLGT